MGLGATRHIERGTKYFLEFSPECSSDFKCDLIMFLSFAKGASGHQRSLQNRELKVLKSWNFRKIIIIY